MQVNRARRLVNWALNWSETFPHTFPERHGIIVSRCEFWSKKSKLSLSELLNATVTKYNQRVSTMTNRTSKQTETKPWKLKFAKGLDRATHDIFDLVRWITIVGVTRFLWVDTGQGHCQRKNNYLPQRKFGIWPPLISHGFFGSDQANPHRFKYSEFSSDSAE